MNRPSEIAGKAIIRKNSKILLLQRSLTSSFDPGRWELPGGKLSSEHDTHVWFELVEYKDYPLST